MQNDKISGTDCNKKHVIFALNRLLVTTLKSQRLVLMSISYNITMYIRDGNRCR